MQQVSSFKNSNLKQFAEFLEGGNGTDELGNSFNVKDDGIQGQDQDSLRDQLQNSRPSVDSKGGQNAHTKQDRSGHATAGGARGGGSKGQQRSQNQTSHNSTNQNQQQILQQNEAITRGQMTQQQIQKFERFQNQAAYPGAEIVRLNSQSNSPTNQTHGQGSRAQRASNKKIPGGTNIIIEQNQIQPSSHLMSAQGQVSQISGTGVPYYGVPTSLGQTGSGGLLSTSSKKQGAVNQAHSIIGENGHVSAGQNQANGGYRNSKNRKLYTSIGQYNQGHPIQKAQMMGHPGDGVSPALVQVPMIDFGSSQNYQRNLMVSQQNSVGSNAQVPPLLLSHQISLSQGNQHKVGGMKLEAKGKGNGNQGRASKSGPKNGKKMGNSSVLVMQPRELHTAQNMNNNSLVGISENDQNQQLSGTQLAYAQAQAYNSMISNNETNLNDMSVLSGASQSINFAQRQNAGAVSGSGQPGSVTSSVIIERAGTSQNGKKGKKVTNSKTAGQTEASWSGGGRGPGGLPVNHAKVGNFVGGNSHLDSSFSEPSGPGAPPAKASSKKVTSKMVPAGTHSKAAQHQQYLHNQINPIHFVNDFSVDGSVTSVKGPQVHGNGVQQQFIVLSGNAGNGMSSGSQVMAQPKQRPHSSFKAQTQKSINTYKAQLINAGGGAVAAGNGAANGSANGRAQLLLMPGATANVPGKTVGSRKSKHLTHQVNAGKNKYGLGPDQLNSTSVYQSDLVTEPNSRESRRMGRGSSGIGGGSGVAAIELGNITKEHRELRTSSATAGNTNTEFGLLGMNGLSGQSGTGPNGLPNFSNQNQHYMLGGTSATHALSGASGLSGLSGGAVSAHTAGGGPGSKTGTGSLMFNQTSSSQTNQKQAGKNNKMSKRNITAKAGGNFNFMGPNILPNPAMTLNGKQQEQIAILSSKNNNKLQSNKFEKIDSMRSGDGGREGGRGGKGSKSITGTHLNTQAVAGAGGYGLSMFPANKYDQQQQAKASKESHQQSMQKFLQQQMTDYNTTGNQSSGSKSKKSAGVKSTSKQHNIAVTQYLQHPQGQGQIQGGQGQGGAAVGYVEAYSNKQTQQKLTKKQIQQQNLLASDRLREAQRGIESGGASRKAGTQTAIGTGAKRGALNSSQIQISNQGQRPQASSLTRSRGTSHTGKGQQASATTAGTRVAPGGGAQSVVGNPYPKRGVQVLSSISGAQGTLGPMGPLVALSGTPGIQGNSKIALLGGSASNQRNYNSNVQNTNHSGQMPRQEIYNSSSRRNKRGGAATISSGGGAGGLGAAGSGYGNRTNGKRGTGANTGHGGLVDGTDFSAFGYDGQPGSFDASQMHIQIQIAEQALRDMRMSLNRPRAATEFGGSIAQQQQTRPKSQNDAQNYALSAQELTNAAEVAEALSQESRPLEAGQDGIYGRNYDDNDTDLKLDQTQEVNSNFMDQHQSKINDGFLTETIHKDQFLDIISSALGRISSSLHPRVGSSLDEIRSMYDAYLEQLDATHQEELQHNALQIQQQEARIDELKDLNQQLRLQIGHNKQSSDLLQQLKKQVADNKKVKEQMAKLQEKYDQQTSQFNHLKNNIEKQRGNQNTGTENAVLSYFDRQQIKESKESQNKNHIARDLDQLEKMRRAERAERAERTSELEKNLNAGLRFGEDRDLLSLVDAPIVIHDRNDPESNIGGGHIRISNGEIVEGRMGAERRTKDSRRGLESGHGDASDELSSIPSYDRGAGRESRIKIGRQGDGGSNLATDLEELRMLNEAEDLDLGDFSLPEGLVGENSQTGRERLGRDTEREGAQQSYFSSQASDTIDSEALAVLQAANSEHGGVPPGFLNLYGPNTTSGSSQGQGPNMNMFSQGSPYPQDKSPIKVPALPFWKMEQQAQQEAQEEAEGSECQNPGEAEPAYGSEVPDSFSQSDYGLIDQLQPGVNMQEKPKVPGLGGFSLPKTQDQKAQGGGIGGLGFNLAIDKVKEKSQVQQNDQDFHQEFIAKIDEFSESWRKQLREEGQRFQR